MTQEHGSGNDNAGNGVRGLRAEPSKNLLRSVRDYYGLNGLEESIDLGGSSSLNLLTIHNEERYVVRVYRPYVTEARLADINQARQTLNDNGIPTSKILPTLDGQPWIVYNNRLVEVERYVESDAYMDTWEHLMIGLPLLGKIHNILRNVQFRTDGRFPLFANYIEPQKALNMTLRGVQRIRSWDHSSNNIKLADSAEQLANLVFEGEREIVSQLPRQMVHGDYWHNNVFIREGRVVHIADFDFMGERARIDDLALTLYYYQCSNERVSQKQLYKLRQLVDAYDGGLDEHLSRTELAALPLAMARQPLWSIGGWIALLDDERAAYRHATSMLSELKWALRIVRELSRWQTAFM